MRNYDDIKAEIRAEFEDEIPNIDERDIRGALPLVLSREDCRKLIEYFSGEDEKSIRNRLIIKTLYYTGMRIGELAELKKADINFNEGIIFIRSGKNDKDRYVCIDPETLHELQIWAEKMDLTTSLFGISDRQCRRVVEKAGSETGIADKYEGLNRVFSAHSLRHAFATHSIENGMNIFTLKKLLGHEYLDTTEIYVHTSMKFDQAEYIKSRGKQ
jgi:integrase/recombinase XerD